MKTFAVALCALLLGCAGASESSTGQSGGIASPTPTSTQLRVSGNRFVDQDGAAIRLLGVNHDGSEYMCVQGRGIFDSPADDALVASIATWHVNVVRVPLNEHCWLGTSKTDPRYSGQVYRDAIAGFVSRLRARGLFVILEVHWSSAGEALATRQEPMLDRERGLPFWTSVAQTFSGDRGIVFDAFNEPFLDASNTRDAFQGDVWECWRLGCTVFFGGTSYVSAGAQPIVDAIRSTGAKNVIMVGGLAYSNDLSGMLAHLPYDREHALAASAHVYAINKCNNESCWNPTLASVAAEIPLVTGEIGQTDCKGDFVTRYMAWADARAVSYLAWTFNPGDCAARPSLVTDWQGTPTPFGQVIRDRFAALPR